MNEFVFEGYPRSGNTYFVDSIDIISRKNGVSLKIHHHTHSEDALSKGIQNGIPVLSPIRNPGDACASFMVYSGENELIALSRWIGFYEYVYKNICNIKTLRFETITNNFETVVSELNGELGLDLEWFDVDSEVKKVIRERAKRQHKEMINQKAATPTEQRTQALKISKKKILQSPIFPAAKSLYEKVIQYSV